MLRAVPLSCFFMISLNSDDSNQVVNGNTSSGSSLSSSTELSDLNTTFLALDTFLSVSSITALTVSTLSMRFESLDVTRGLDAVIDALDVEDENEPFPLAELEYPLLLSTRRFDKLSLFDDGVLSHRLPQDFKEKSVCNSAFSRGTFSLIIISPLNGLRVL